MKRNIPGLLMFSHLSIRAKLSLCFSLVGLIVLIVISAMAYVAVQGRLYDDIRTRLNDTVAVAAMVVPVDEHAKVLKAEDETTETYTHLKAKLKQIRELIQDVKFVYTLRVSPDNKLMFVVDAEEDPNEMSHPGDIYEDAPEGLAERIKSISATYVETEPYTDQWGTFMSAYAPLKTSTGKVDGAIAVDISVQSINKSLRSFLVLIVLCTLILAIPIIGLGFFLGGVFARPINTILTQTERVTSGDFEVKFDTGGTDEFARLAQGMDTMVQSLRLALSEVVQAVSTLADSSGALTTVAGEMSSQAGASSARSETVATTAEEMNTSIHSMATGMEEAFARLENLSTSTEQMTLTIGEIAGNAENARSITAEAVNYSGTVLNTIAQLNQAAQKINLVTDTITAISGQTNLLALNATIEAARAGEAGKGFAVVAGEIKDLAKQTANATEDIKDKITAIQSSTADAIADMEKISRVIETVNEIVATIASAIKKQDHVTREIALDISQANIAVQSANKQTSQSEGSVRTITKDIIDVSQASRQITAASHTVEKSAADLSTLAGHLRSMVEKFKV